VRKRGWEERRRWGQTQRDGYERWEERGNRMQLVSVVRSERIGRAKCGRKGSEQWEERERWQWWKN
jgi:hypothetical protein